MYMILFVLNDPQKLEMILDAWKKSGVGGTTIYESTGAFRKRMRIPGRCVYH